MKERHLRPDLRDYIPPHPAFLLYRLEQGRKGSRLHFHLSSIGEEVLGPAGRVIKVRGCSKPECNQAQDEISSV